MSGPPTLPEACRALGLRCRCELSHTEPRFTIDLEQEADGARLALTLRNDDSIVHRVVHCDLEVPGLLLSIAEQTIQREPVMDLWLPQTAEHRYVLFRPADRWRLEALPGLVQAETVREAITGLEDPRR